MLVAGGEAVVTQAPRRVRFFGGFPFEPPSLPPVVLARDARGAKSMSDSVQPHHGGDRSLSHLRTRSRCCRPGYLQQRTGCCRHHLCALRSALRRYAWSMHAAFLSGGERGPPACRGRDESSVASAMGESNSGQTAGEATALRSAVSTRRCQPSLPRLTEHRETSSVRDGAC